MEIARVFPRRTKATPVDDLVFFDGPPFDMPQVDEVHVSVTFTWDKPRAEYLAQQWRQYYPTVLIDGPAYNNAGGPFKPGLYLKPGYTITSRGYPNRCGFCLAWKREGNVRPIAIKPGWIIQDNNLLACPRSHVEAVLQMLSQQTHKAEFSGGLEAVRVESWFVKALTEIRFKRVHFGYDRPNERKPVAEALRLFRQAGQPHWKLSCYVLVGFEGDTIDAAEERCQFVKDNGAVPFPMYFQPPESKGTKPTEWQNLVGRILNSPGCKEAK
ncbi:MAG: hypothetical protein LLG01_00770 [Planctomycetaceae bacterium]|nr:hypothetical protein [Planctomycetaceae bacterium]